MCVCVSGGRRKNRGREIFRADPYSRHALQALDYLPCNIRVLPNLVATKSLLSTRAVSFRLSPLQYKSSTQPRRHQILTLDMRCKL
ncbi:hypothetical protein RRG08_013515 [Elysia crispata]|uniref:Uncharacterized protein n=1 Tax=Elysia crispata TaxID=231223 RepID=A0AAE0Y0K3_9GAST|nr:hypothetical protein RRG08_013515 [Elysia crispata]